MQGGKAAAQTILDMRAAGDYSKLSTRIYEQRWMKAFGHDFAFVCPSVRSVCVIIRDLHAFCCTFPGVSQLQPSLVQVWPAMLVCSQARNAASRECVRSAVQRQR